MALPIEVAPSRMVTVAPASPTSTVPVRVTLAWLVGPPALLIATTGAVVSSVNKTGALALLLPVVLVSMATMLWGPSPDRVTLVLHKPPLPTTVVASGVVLPLSNSVTVVPT